MQKGIVWEKIIYFFLEKPSKKWIVEEVDGRR